jgi:tetratricopeptide (TPR) repeat protein
MKKVCLRLIGFFSSRSPTMLKRRTKIILILAGLVVALAWLAWPYYALYDLITAVRNGDPVALEERVAWDSVRQGLRGDLNAFLLEKARSNDAGSALGTALTVTLGPAIINQLIDSYLTPQALPIIFRTGRPPENLTQAGHSGSQTSATTGQPFQPQVKYAFFSGGPLTFKVEIIPENRRARGPVTLLFKWSGEWRLTRIILPNLIAAAIFDAGETHRGKGEYDLAIQKFTEAIRLNSNYAEAYYRRGDAYNRKDDRVRAIADYTEAIRLDPKYALAYNGRGIAYRLNEDYDRAIADYTEAIHLDPKYTFA